VRPLATALLLLGLMQAVPAASCLQPFGAHYRLLYRDELVGHTYFRLRLGAEGSYSFDAYTTPTANLSGHPDHEVLEGSAGTIDNAGIHPRDYYYSVRDQGQTQVYEMHFDHAAGLLRIRNREQQEQLPLREGAQDRLSYLLRAMQACDRAAEPQRFPLVEAGTTREVELRSGAVQQVQVPWGTTEARRLERYSGSATPDRILWLARSTGAVPVLVEHPSAAGMARMELERLETP